MRKTSVILFTLLFAISIFSQTEDQKPILADEFGNIGSDDMAARLDNLMSQVLENPNAKGLIRIYGNNENCFLCHFQRGSWIEAYLKHTRKFSSEKYSIEHCTYSEAQENHTEFYLLPQFAEITKCSQSVEVPKQSVLFEKILFYFNDNKIYPLESEYVDVVAPADGEYSLNVLGVIKKFLKESVENKIYVVVYLGTNLESEHQERNGKEFKKKRRNLDEKSLANKMLSIARKELIKNGIHFSQILTTRGGYVDEKRRLEFWFIPKGGAIPKPKPDYFPKKKRK